MIAVNDIPYHVIASQTFVKFVDDFNANFHIPSQSTLSRDMKRFSDEINHEVLEALKGKIVSLLNESPKNLKQSLFLRKSGYIFIHFHCYQEIRHSGLQ